MTTTPSPSDDERYQRGLELLEELHGETGRKVIDSLSDIAPDLGCHIVSHAFGDVYSRPGLDLRQRQLVTLSSLTALGGCEAQLEVHIACSLNVGLSPVEIVEALMHSAVYCGFPKALNAVFVAQKVFGERGLLPVNGANGESTKA